MRLTSNHHGMTSARSRLGFCLGRRIRRLRRRRRRRQQGIHFRRWLRRWGFRPWAGGQQSAPPVWVEKSERCPKFSLVGGFNLPLWKIWVRQLGWWHSQYIGKINMFQTTNQLQMSWKFAFDRKVGLEMRPRLTRLNHGKWSGRESRTQTAYTSFQVASRRWCSPSCVPPSPASVFAHGIERIWKNMSNMLIIHVYNCEYIYIYTENDDSPMEFVVALFSDLPYIVSRKRRLASVSSLSLILVGGIPTHLKNIKVCWDHYSQYMEKWQCSKPPTRICWCPL